MAPRLLGNASRPDGQSLQLRVADLEKSDLPLQQRLEEAGAILKWVSPHTRHGSHNSGQDTGINVPLPILKWLFRWLLKQLDDVGSRGNSLPTQTDFWKLFNRVISQLPPNVLAQTLKSDVLLPHLDRTLQICLESIPRSRNSSPTGHSSNNALDIATFASEGSGITASGPLKRKRDHDETATRNGASSKLDGQALQFQTPAVALFNEVSGSLNQLVTKSGGSSNALPNCEEEFVKKVFSAGVEEAIPLFSKALRFMKALSKDEYHGDTGNSFRETAETMLGPFLMFWTANGIIGQEVELEQSQAFCTGCLSDLVMLLPILRERNDIEAYKRLEDMVYRMAINPARRNYLMVKNPKEKSGNLSFLVQYFDNLGTASTDINTSASTLKEKAGLVSEPQAVLLELALRKLPENTALRSTADEDWLCAFFEYLALQPYDQSVSSEQHDRSTWFNVVRELLSLANQKKLRLGATILETIIDRVLKRNREDELNVEQWHIIGLCISLDSGLALIRAKSGLSNTLHDLLNRTISVTYQPARSLRNLPAPNGSLSRAVVDHFISPFFKCYVQARQFDQFVVHWHHYLSASRHSIRKQENENDEAGLERTLEPQDPWAKSVWEDAALGYAVRSYATHSPPQVAGAISSLTKDLAWSGSAKKRSRLYSSLHIIYTIMGSAFPDVAISLLESCMLEVRDKTAKSLRRADLLSSSPPLMWSVFSTLIEQWPNLYLEWDEKRRTEVTDLAQNAVQLHQSFLHNNDLDDEKEPMASFSAFAFLWRSRNILTSPAQSRYAQNLPFVLEAEAPLLKPDDLKIMTTNVNDRSQESQSAEEYIALHINNPWPLHFIEDGAQSTLLDVLTNYVVHKVAKDGFSLTTENTQLLDIDPVRSWLSLEQFEGTKDFHANACAASVRLATAQLEKYQNFTAPWALGSLDPASLSKAERRKIQEILMQEILKFETGSNPVFPHHIAALLAHYMKKPLNTNDELESRLHALLKTQLPESNKTTPISDAKATGLSEQIHKLLGRPTNAKSTPVARLKATVMSDSKMQDASQIFSAFKDIFGDAEAKERVEAIQDLLQKCTLDISSPTLIFARKVCSANYPKDLQTLETKKALQELVSKLFIVSLESRDVRRVLLALRCINAVFAKNSWAIGQTHIDLCLASASQIPARYGSRATKDVPAEGENIGTRANGERRPRARLDLASARRMVFGSLAVRNPKTKDDEMKVRRQLDGRTRTTPGSSEMNGTNEKEAAVVPVDDPEQQLPPELPSLLYTSLCTLLGTTLRSFRARTGGRSHLIVDALRNLLTSLFTPYASPETEMRPWLSGSELTSGNASDFARLLTLLCDPSVSSVQTSKRKDEHAASLHDTTRRARKVAGENMPPLIKEYCAQRLHGHLDTEKRAALTPGLYAAFDAMGMGGEDSVVKVLNETLTRPEREIFRAVWDEYLRFGKWQGG